MAHRIKVVPENEHDKKNMKYVITFGKYKNYKINDIPINYIKWFLNNVDNGSVSERVLAQLIDRIKYSEEKFSSIYSRGGNGKIFQIKLFQLVITLEWI